MLNVFSGVLTAAWDLMLEMSPYLLLGFLAAGILNFLIPKDKIYKHFAGNNLKASFKAALFGVPLPICSCGVIPVAAYLREKAPLFLFFLPLPQPGSILLWPPILCLAPYLQL
jgi:uncharacterized membrane protein YraQ (UPF0718 family)